MRKNGPRTLTSNIASKDCTSWSAVGANPNTPALLTSTPSERIVGIFALLTEWFMAPGYNGCPFINASAETSSQAAVEAVRDRHRAWVRALFEDLGREAGVRDPHALSEQLVLLYDGSMVGAQLDRSPAPGAAAQAAAAALLSAG